MSREVGLNDNPFYRAALAEAEGSEAILQWIQERAEVIHQRVDVHDVLRHFGVKLRYPGGQHEEQISCPFHGKDNRPSCRVYPKDAQSPSHTWCFTCQEWLDAIGTWRKFRGLEKYTHAVGEIEKAYGIIPPEPPLIARRRESAEEQENLEELYEVTERRLVLSKPAFTMKAYLTVGSVLDRLKFRMDAKTIRPDQIRNTLKLVLTKIAERERSWGGG